MALHLKAKYISFRFISNKLEQTKMYNETYILSNNNCEYSKEYPIFAFRKHK